MSRQDPSSRPTWLPVLLSSLLASLAVAAESPQLPQSRPSGFIANAGQWTARTCFAARRGDLDIRLEADGLRLHRTGASSDLALRFGPATEVRGQGEQTTHYQFFVGSRAHWRTGVAAFDAVRYVGVAEGVDVIVHQGELGMQYDLQLDPGITAAHAVLRCNGVDDVVIDDDGTLLIRSDDETMLQTPPRAWQVAADGSHLPVPCGFRIAGERAFGFWTAPLDPDLPTVIDPQVDYATWLGGSVYDDVYDVAVDAQGAVYVAGDTRSPDLVPTVPLYGTTGPANDPETVYVAKLDPTAAPGASLVWLALIGGNGADIPDNLALGPADATVHVTGLTLSTDFPTATTNTSLQGYHGDFDAFVTCLDAATGSTLLYSVLIGEAGADFGCDLAVDANGNTYLTGSTQSDGSSGFSGDPSPRVYGPRGDRDVFVAELDPTATWFHSAVLGGAGNDVGWSIGLDAQGNIFVAGDSDNDPGQPSGWFPRVLAGPKVPGGGGGHGKHSPKTDTDGFLIRLDPLLDLQYSSLLGGSAGDGLGTLAIDGTKVHVAGGTQSSDFATVAPVVDPGSGLDGSVLSGGSDGLVATLDFGSFAPGTFGPSLVFATYFGTRMNESFDRIAVDGGGNLIALGTVTSSHGGQRSYPVTGTPQLKSSLVDGDRDCVLVALAPSGGSRSYAYGSLIGGDGREWGRGLAIAPDGSWIVALLADSSYLYTTPNAVLQSRPGSSSTYVRELPSPLGNQ